MENETEKQQSNWFELELNVVEQAGLFASAMITAAGGVLRTIGLHFQNSKGFQLARNSYSVIVPPMITGDLSTFPLELQDVFAGFVNTLRNAPIMNKAIYAVYGFLYNPIEYKLVITGITLLRLGLLSCVGTVISLSFKRSIEIRRNAEKPYL